ncbi:tectonic-1-like isoform X1 [Epargyreus clarus]|uniref:tectonic-1-like isoform X1 n=1 Tax=Epargyreus clarus TaxID=520877 RepID=UPI003C2E35FA
MNPLTYLGFTIFSVFIQFCVMEFIHDRFQLDKDSKRLNESTQKNNDIIKKINYKPHALFYRTEIDQMSFTANNYPQSSKYSNSSLEDMQMFTSTEIPSTTLDIFYDENATVTDDFITTDSYYTGSEFDNVTEITFIDKTSTTTAKPSPSKTVVSKEKCFCNLLYKKCDLNCCCDSDCTEEERRLFINCIEDNCDISKRKNIFYCNSYPTCDNTISTGLFNNLFCVVKINMPDKRIKSHFKMDVAAINATLKWNVIEKSYIPLHFQKKKYEFGDLLWLLQNDHISPTYLPTTAVNNYCNGKKPMKFLINENIKCNVKIEELHAFPTLKTLEKAKLISVTDLSLNNTILNCSTLHCANWSIIVCDFLACGDFNHTIHAPICTENYCINLPLRVEYSLYYYESKITNATLKLYMSKVSINVHLMLQEIIVKWYLGNDSIENIIQLSGNPGYIPGLPIIASSAADNHTHNFYNRTFGKNYISFPINENGKCVWSNTRNKTLLFGFNTRSKCRLSMQQKIFQRNATSACHSIQMNIKEYAGLIQKLLISPYGNPQDVNDDKWVPLEVNDRKFIFGEYHSKNSKLNCYNIITRYVFVIAFADVSGNNKVENKIIKASVDTTAFNITFDTAELSMVLTIDISFVDISRPVSEFARAPHINVHLPTNFFFDYPSNKCYILGSDTVLLSSLVVLILIKK